MVENSTPKAKIPEPQSFAFLRKESPAVANIPAPPAEVVDRLLTTTDKLDKFGNPEGEDLGLVKKKEFEGANILVWSVDPEVIANIFTADNPIWEALRDKGFKIRLEAGRFQADWLDDADQFWMITGKDSGMNAAAETAIVDYVHSGKGLYLVSDNEPYLVDADRLTQRLYKTTVTGNFEGGNLIAIRGRGVTAADYYAAQRGKNTKLSVNGERVEVIKKATHYADDHPLLTDVNFIFEGVTVSHLHPCPGLQTVLKAGDGQILAAVATDPLQRVVVDCGWTRYYYSVEARYVVETAGTIRYAENIAAYLMGKDGKDGNLNWKKIRELREMLGGLLKASPDNILARFADADPNQRFAAVVAAHRRRLDEPVKLIAMLRDANEDVRQQARLALRGLAEGDDYGPPPQATPEEIEKAIAAWEQWLVRYQLMASYSQKSPPELEGLLEDSNPLHRWGAVAVIARKKLNLPDALIARLADEAGEVREQAHQALVLITGVDHGPNRHEEAARAAAIIEWRRWRLPQKYLALYRSEEQTLIAALKSENIEQRWAAANAIFTRDLRLGAELIPLVDHPNPQLRQEAARALANGYKVDFGPAPGADAAAIAAAKQEWENWWRKETAKRAEDALRLAKTFLKNKPEIAKRRLQDLLQQFPNSDAATEARELLQGL